MTVYAKEVHVTPTNDTVRSTTHDIESLDCVCEPRISHPRHDSYQVLTVVVHRPLDNKGDTA